MSSITIGEFSHRTRLSPKAFRPDSVVARSNANARLIAYSAAGQRLGSLSF